MEKIVVRPPGYYQKHPKTCKKIILIATIKSSHQKLQHNAMIRTTLLFNEEELEFTLHNATVIHADKYSETSGGWGNAPVRSHLYTDLVFRSSDTNEDWPVTINGRNLSVYNGQKVMVMGLQGRIIGYVDKQSNKYYYTRDEFSSFVKVGMPVYYIWIIGIIGAMAVFMFTTDESDIRLLYALIPFGVAWLIAIIQKQMISNRIMQLIDTYLREE